MDPTRKKIILNEINFWKQNNMLPEHYCNYLTALYTEGEEERETTGTVKKRKINTELLFNILFLGMIAIALTLTYFTDFSFLLQTMILTIFALILFFVAVYYRKKEESRLVIYITGAFLLLLFSVQMNDTYFEGGHASLYTMLIVNCLIWIVGGIWRKQPFFVAAGSVAGFVLFYLAFIK